MAKGAIHRVWADYDATYGGRRGIMIHASMAVTERRSAQSEQVLLIYWFYYTDGKPVPGASGEFTDSGGSMRVSTLRTPLPSTTISRCSSPTRRLATRGPDRSARTPTLPCSKATLS